MYVQLTLFNCLCVQLLIYPVWEFIWLVFEVSFFPDVCHQTQIQYLFNQAGINQLLLLRTSRGSERWAFFNHGTTFLPHPVERFTPRQRADINDVIPGITVYPFMSFSLIKRVNSYCAALFAAKDATFSASLGEALLPLFSYPPSLSIIYYYYV